MAAQGLSARWRSRILLALIGFYFLFAFAATVLTDQAGLLLLRSGRWRDVDQHWLYGCMILIGGWIALGPGRMLLRALQGMLGIGWLLLIWLLGLTISPNWKFELELTTLVSLFVAATTFAVLIVVRISSGRMLIQTERTSGVGTTRFQYSLTTLLFVMLLVGLSITLFGWIDPKYLNDAALSQAEASWFYTVWRRAMTWKVGTESLGPLLVAAACLPAFLNHRKCSFAWAFGLSACALIVLVVQDEYIRKFVLLPLLLGESTYRRTVHSQLIDSHIAQHLSSVTTLTVCLLTAATAMYWLGYQLSAVKPDSRQCGRG